MVYMAGSLGAWISDAGQHELMLIERGN